MVRKVVIACDDSPHSRIAVDLAMQQIVHKSTDEIHLVHVLPPTSAAAPYPMAPVASAAAVTAVQHGIAAQRAAEAAHGIDTLRLATELVVLDYKVPRNSVHCHVRPSVGGASGVSEAVCDAAKAQGADMVVVGSRGMGSFKRSLMSLVGLGSVSDAVLRAAPCRAVVVIKAPWDPADTRLHEPAEARPPPPAPAPKKVGVAVDESPSSRAALEWALAHILGPHDHLHVLCVAPSVPFPVLDEPGAAAAMETREAEAASAEAARWASRVSEEAAEEAVKRGVTRTKLCSVMLTPSNGGASDIGSAIASYATDKKLDVVVVGSRGMGALHSSLMSLVGLGSVSDYLAHNLNCTLAVVRDTGAADAAAQALQGGGSSLDAGGQNIPFQVIAESDVEGDKE